MSGPLVGLGGIIWRVEVRSGGRTKLDGSIGYWARLSLGIEYEFGILKRFLLFFSKGSLNAKFGIIIHAWILLLIV